MADAKVLDARKVPSMDSTRKGKLDWLVTYQTDPLHTFVLFIPAEAMTEAAVHEAIKKDQADRAKVVGKLFPI